MRRRLFFWELAGFLFTGALGVLLGIPWQRPFPRSMSPPGSI